jgi:hypothetical protein
MNKHPSVTRPYAPLNNACEFHALHAVKALNGENGPPSQPLIAAEMERLSGRYPGPRQVSEALHMLVAEGYLRQEAPPAGAKRNALERLLSRSVRYALTEAGERCLRDMPPLPETRRQNGPAL